MSPPYLHTFLRLYRHLHWPEAKLQAYQKEQLVKILKWSAEQIPFYRQRFLECGLMPANIFDPEELARRLPLTERIDLQRQPESFFADNMNPGKCKIYATSGSTGEPVKVWFSQKEEAIRGALSVRNRLVAGGSPFRRVLSFGGSIANRRVSVYQHLGIYPIRRLPACAPQAEVLRTYREYRPHILTGYASAIQCLGESLQQSGNRFPKPEIIMPIGEMLPENTRRSLREAFQAPVRDLYGTEELGYLAWECSRGGYHLNTDCFYFEVLRDGRPAPVGTEGELVVTSLYMKTMPLIRYRLGDRVVLDPEPCGCGCAFPRLKSIQGRLDDFLVLPDGEKVHAVLAVYAFKALKEVRRFQVIQEEDGGFQIRLVSCPWLNPEQINGLHDYFRTHFQTDDVRIDQADEIPVGPPGKWRPVVCRKRHL